MMFCIPKDELSLLLENEIKRFTFEEILKFFETGLTLEEMAEQQINESGPFNEACTVAIKKFSNKTENVEIHLALSLSDIYSLGPKNEISICFEMKDDFNKKISNLSDLTANIECATHIDCSIVSRKKEWRFQMKRYPSEYLKFNDKKIISYLKKIFSKYGEMADTNLIILLQPTQKAATTPINFEKIYQSMKSIASKISFGEVSFIFNANMKNIMLIRVFPDFIKTKVPLKFKSPKYQELQKKWEEEIRKQKS